MAATPPPPHVQLIDCPPPRNGPPHVLPIDCPPPRYEYDEGGETGGRLRRVWPNAAACKNKACPVVAAVLFGTAVVAFFVILTVLANRPLLPVYTVTITGVAGQDPAPAARAVVVVDPPADDDSNRPDPPPTTLSPVFNLTLQFDSKRTGFFSDACVPGLSRAEVSYGDAFLAAGSLPPFCDAEMSWSSDGAAARAWGDNVAVPRFLVAGLAAGNASVDVRVTVAAYCTKSTGCRGAVLSCKPKIGRGPSPACRFDFR